MRKIKTLQDLRGIAIIMVVLFHSGNNYTALVNHGDNGVLLFFMISGFIISGAHSKDYGLTDFIIFIKKRISRIHFPYFPIIILLSVMFVITGKGGAYHHDPINIALNILLLHPPSESIHPYAWTLVFEMFYYLAFGCLFILLKRGIIPLALALSIPPIIYQLYQGEETRNLITSFYNLYFLSGVLLERINRNHKLHSNPILTTCSFLVFLALPFLTESKTSTLLSTIIFFTLYLNLSSNFAPLERLGNASYTIYLSHALVISAGKQIMGNSFLQFITFFILSITLGYGYYIISERWLTNIGRRVLGLYVKKK